MQIYITSPLLILLDMHDQIHLDWKISLLEYKAGIQMKYLKQQFASRKK